MKYLAFDIEIARDFGKLPFGELKPVNGEKIEALVGPDENDDWIQGTYWDGKLSIPEKEFETEGLFWRPIADVTDWKRFRPLGITCAAAASSDGGLWNWWAHDALGKFAPKMIRSQCYQMVDDLIWLTTEGYTFLTWNGLGFDFHVLAEESGRHEECKELALNHIDMMFHFFCGKGFPLGLDKACKGMGLPGKPEGMDGAKAPELWPTDPHGVMSYCSLDVKNTLALAEAVDNAHCLGWTAQSGRQNTWYAEKWLTVREAMELPLPNTSWMSDPWPRSKFYGWTGYQPPEPAPPADMSHLVDLKDWQLYDDPEDW